MSANPKGFPLTPSVFSSFEWGLVASYRRKALGLTCGLIFLTLIPRDASAEFQWGRLKIHPGLALTTKYNDNVFLEADKTFNDGTQEGRQADLILMTSPSLRLIQKKKKGDFFGFKFRYLGVDEHFIDLRDQDIFKHDVSGNLSLGNPAGVWELDLGGRHYITRDPISTEFGSNFNPRIDRKETHATGNLDWQIAKTLQLNLNAHFLRNLFDEFRFRFESRDMMKSEGNVYWQISPLTQLEIKYIYQTTRYQYETSINFDSNTHTVSAGVEWKPNPIWRLHALSGFNSIQFDGLAEQNRNDLIYEAEVEYTPSRLTKINLYGFRRIKNSSFRDVQAFDKKGFGMTIYRQLALKWFSEIKFLFENNGYDVAVPDDLNGNILRFRVDERLMFHTNLNYKIQEWWVVRAGYKYVKNWSNFDRQNYRNHVVNVTLSFKF
jgi:hypothetical protein